MTVFLNGQFVSAEHAVVSVFDRSFLYGDGLFETMFVWRGRPFRWEDHFRRLQLGAELLRLELPGTSRVLLEQALELIRRNSLPCSILRLTVSRGSGTRGYSIRDTTNPCVTMTQHATAMPLPSSPLVWRLITASVLIPARDPIARIKSCNKLAQILARCEAEAAGGDEALLLNTENKVAETASGNLFWIERGRVFTPPLDSGCLPGVTRGVVWSLCQSLGVQVAEKDLLPEDLLRAEGVFVTQSSLGVIEVASVDGMRMLKSEVTARLSAHYWQLLEAEVASGV